MATPRRTAFVPRVVLSTVFLGVVPACALTACSSSDDHDVALAIIAFDGATDSADSAQLGVAADAFSDSLVALADIGFRPDTDVDDATDGGDASPADGASDTKSDVPLGVAADAFSG